MKGYGYNYFFMPVWDDEELMDANELLDSHLRQNQAELMERVELAGPIPRFVLYKEMKLETLRRKIKCLLENGNNLLDILAFVQGNEAVSDNHYSHHLLKMIPLKHTSRAGDVDFRLEFLSGEISRMVLFEAKKHVVAEFKRFALENDDPDSAKFRGDIYEHLIHRRFKEKSLPGSLSGKRLADGSAFEIPLPKKI